MAFFKLINATKTTQNNQTPSNNQPSIHLLIDERSEKGK
jgi:hypothetical protein